MAKVPAGLTREQLGQTIDRRMPAYRGARSIEAWATEKAIALAEWNAPLPLLRPGSPVPCCGGPLVCGPVSAAKPLPLPSQRFEQPPLL